MILRIGVFLMLLTAAVIAPAQSTKDSVKMLETALKERPRMLRGFSSDREVVWRWDGSKLVQEPPLGHMLTMLEISSVKLHGKRLDIEGTRRDLLRGSDTEFELGKFATPATVRIELVGADPAAVLPTLVDAIFYANERAGLDEIPADYRSMLPQDAKPDCCTARPNKPFQQGCPVNETDGKKGRVTPPRLLNQVDPEFSEEAKQKKFSGNVQVGMLVDRTGKTKDIWVVRPAGLGLDEKAVAAVSQYQFRPASCGDVPVPVTIYVEVNFQIF